MAEDIKPKDDVKGDVKVPGEKGKDGKKGNFWEKYKWFIILGVVVVVGIVGYVLMHNSSSNNAANTNPPADTSNIDPATGYPYGSPADLAALGSSGSINPTSTGGTVGGGADGAAGAAGPAGPTGPPGKDTLWAVAISILNGRGITNPTHSQIHTVWQNLSHAAGGKNAPPPVRTPTPVHKPPHPKVVKK